MKTSALPKQPRRLVVAIAAGVLLATLLAGFSGAATDDEAARDLDGPIPPTLRLGDAATYYHDQGVRPPFKVVVNTAGVVYDIDGVARFAVRLETDRDSARAGPEGVSNADLASGRAISTSGWGSGVSESHDGNLFGARDIRRDLNYSFRFHAPAAAPPAGCLTLIGQPSYAPLDANSVARRLEQCYTPASFWRQHPALRPDYAFAGLDEFEVDGAPMSALRMEPSASSRMETPDGSPIPTLRAWVSPSVPFLVRLERGPGANAGPDLQLVSFLRGVAPLAATTPLPTPLGPLPTGARSPWGLPETGFYAEFPPSAAWRIALQYPPDPTFRDFIARHPDAIAVSAEYNEAVTFAGRSRAWAFVVSDGSAAMTVKGEQEFLGGALPAPPRERLHYSRLDRAPPIDGLPDVLPTIHGLMERWARYVPKELAAVEPTPRFHLASDNATLVIGLTGAGADSWAELTFTNGSVRRLEHGRFRQTETPSLPLVSTPDAPAPLPPRPASAADSTFTWKAPSLGESVDIGLFAVGAAAAIWLWPTLRSGALMPLFSRVVGPKALEHKHRSLIAELVRSEPGIHFGEIVRRTGLGRGTVRHHLRVLSATRILREHSGPRYSTYFAIEAADRRVMLAADALKAPGARDLLRVVLESPGINGSQAAATAGISRQAAARHVHRFEERGLIEVRRGPGMFSLSATSLAALVTAKREG